MSIYIYMKKYTPIYRDLFRFIYILSRPHSSNMSHVGFSCKTMLPDALKCSGVCHLPDLTNVQVL